MSWLLNRRSSFQPTAQAAVCVGHSFSSGLTAEQPQPPGAGHWGCENHWPLPLLLL